MIGRFSDDGRSWRAIWIALAVLSIVPAVVLFVSLVGLLQTDAAVLRGGIQVGMRGPLVAGEATIDPNFGATSNALGTRAALDVVAGRLPLWNHYEGFGAPLLGEMQSAALFPFTWLMAFRHGQTIEQALLQLLGGIGAWVFFRRFGIGGRAALAGAIVFEVNGVFAWLRNAIFNPVAFLPWLFYSVETAAALAADDAPWKRRAFNISLGAAMSALAVYAGFPEEVYLYSLLVAVWTTYRFFGLRGGARVTFLADLCAIAILGLGLSAPALASFAAYLPESVLGGHAEGGFVGTFLPPTAALLHILPYVFGSIFNQSSSAEVSDIWGNIGGYVGLAPLLLSAAALFVPGRRVPKILLAGWIVVCIAVTFGIQPIYDAFMMAPLAGITACYRYITISMIFSFIFLAVMFIDAIDKPADRSHRGWMALAILLTTGLTGWAALLASPVFEGGSVRPLGYVWASTAIGVLVLLAICFALFARTRRSATILTGAFVAEAIALFAIPYLSYPRRGDIDQPLISFLVGHVGFSRVLATEAAGIAPNYGSYFGVSTINYNDLPAPARAADYIRANLDRFADPLIFIPSGFGITADEQAERRKALRPAFPAYARAGVKYVVAQADFGLAPAFATEPNAPSHYDLANDAWLDIAIPGPEQPEDIAVLGMIVSTHRGAATGALAATLCAQADCARGRVDLAEVGDNQPARIELDRSLHVASDYRIRLEKIGGERAVGVWMFPVAASSGVTTRASPAASMPGAAPRISIGGNVDRFVYQDKTVGVIELPDVRDYMSAGSCKLHIASRDDLTADCPEPTRLVRLELFMQGWEASVDGETKQIDAVEDAFQGVDLPAGVSHVRFVYWPKYFGAALAAAAASLALVLVGFLVAARAAASWGQNPGRP